MAKSAELMFFSTEAPDLKTMVLRFSPCPMGKSARRQGASSRIHINARIPGSKSKISRTRGQGTQHPQILLNSQATFNTFSPFPMGKMQSKQDRPRHRNSRAQAPQMAPFPHAQWANRPVSMTLIATLPTSPQIHAVAFSPFLMGKMASPGRPMSAESGPRGPRIIKSNPRSQSFFPIPNGEIGRCP